MIKSILSGVLILLVAVATAQVQTQVIGDSVYIRSNSSTGELILENSTKNVNGFLFNKGDGRTEFRNGLVKINDSIYVIGADTLNLAGFNGAWKLKGNSGTDSANFLGTTDSNRLVIKTNNQQRLSVLPDGTVNVASTDTTTKPLFRIYPNGDFTANAENDIAGSEYGANNGIRYTSKYGLFEVGTNNKIDTTDPVSCCGSLVKSAIIVNSDFLNTFKSEVHAAIVAGDNMTIDTAGHLHWGALFGESHNINGSIARSVVTGWGMAVKKGGSIDNSFVSGSSNTINKPFSLSILDGYKNANQDTTYYSLISGQLNKYGGVGQFLAGNRLTNRTPFGTTLGNNNVDFITKPYTGLKGHTFLQNIEDLQNYPIFAIGNSSHSTDTMRSNAMTILYNGRTQINTTGYDTTLTETDVTPKAAFEVVSKNSGILIPRLSDSQRDSIASGDLHNGLLIYNSDTSKFQYYNGSAWRTLGDAGPNSIQSLEDSSTIVWNGAQGTNAAVTLAGTDRDLSITNPQAGQTYRIKIVQDGTGNRTIGTWPTGTLWPSGMPPALSTDASAIDMVTLYYDGSNYFGDYKLLYEPISTGVNVYAVDAKDGFSATTHSLSSVPAGALLVLTTTAGSSQQNASITSTPSLTWTKRVDASNASSGDAEIYTAVFTAGGSINITSDWSNQPQASVCYTITNQESSWGGASGSATAQSQPLVSLTTTRANSLVIAATSDWNAVNGTNAYRGTPIETRYAYYSGSGTFYHYYKEAPTVTSYDMGLTAPSTQSSGTAVIEIRGN